MSTLVITYIGALERIKGADLLLRAFSKARTEQDCVLWIVGDGSYKTHLLKLVRLLRTQDKVFLTGMMTQEEIGWIYLESDIIALTPRWAEPFSRVMLEGLFFGKPILATNVGGNSDGVIDGVNGFLTTQNVDDISTKLRIMIRNKRLRRKMSKQSLRIYNDLV